MRDINTSLKYIDKSCKYIKIQNLGFKGKLIAYLFKKRSIYQILVKKLLNSDPINLPDDLHKYAFLVKILKMFFKRYRSRSVVLLLLLSPWDLSILIWRKVFER